MLLSFLQLWRARQGRRAAVAAVGPLVARSRMRLDEIPEHVWLDPYMVGFIVMLITLIAKTAAGRLDTQAMGLVQCEAWAEITGLKADLIGEEVLLLSSAGDKSFEDGCLNAVAFNRALRRTSMLRDDEQALAEGAAPMAAQSGNIAALWNDYFDQHIS